MHSGPSLSYIDVCTGLSAASVAWSPLHFKPLAFAEIEKYPSSLLKHRYPTVPNAGDFTTIQGTEYGAPDILAGGTPCQSFSIAGKREGLSDERGNLALEFIKLAYRSNPEFILWENVPGVLSSSKGYDFRAFLHGLSGVGLPVPQKGWGNTGIIAGMDGHYSLAWRVLDAQYFGVPQRRRRLFLIGHRRDWRRAISVLLEPEGLLGYSAPSREVGKTATHDVAPSLVSSGRGVECIGESSGQFPVIDGDGVCSFPCWWDGGQLSQTLDAVLSKGQCMPEKNRFPAVLVNILENVRVRRLTPRECERLQGFPDDYTIINDKTADGPRYKALGNSMAVPVMNWIGRRMQKYSERNFIVCN